MHDRVIGLLEPEFEVVGVVEDGHALLKADSQLQPDVCVVDISMPLVCGIDAAAKLKASGSKAKIVVLTIYDDRDFLQAASKGGALGYVVKSRMASDPCAAIHDALADRIFISSTLALGTED